MGLTSKSSSFVQDKHRSLGVLVVDEEVPYPLTSGKRIRTFNLLKHLSSRHRITFLCHSNLDKAELRDAVQRFDELGIATVFLKRHLPKQTLLTPAPQLFVQLAFAFFSTFPYVVHKHLSGELQRQVARLANRDNIDLVHFEWTPYAAVIKKGFTKPWIVDAHNCESIIWKRYFQTERNVIKRWYMGKEWKKFERFEKKIFQAASQTVFVSEVDRSIAESVFDCRRHAVVENGVDVAQFTFNDLISRSPNKMLFLGGLDWRPNVDGVMFLLDEIWPQVRRLNPHIQLEIVGRCPSDRLIERIRNEQNVMLHANVPSVQPFLASARAMLVPLRIGGGSRLKILEAAASGLPVISSTIGAEGLDLRPEKHFIEANTSHEFTAAILESVRNTDRLNQMVRTARQVIECHYDWSFLAEKLELIWLKQVSRS